MSFTFQTIKKQKSDYFSLFLTVECGVGGWGKIQILIWIKKEFYFKTYFFVLISSITFAKILNFYELELRRKMYFVIMIKDVLDCVFLGQLFPFRGS